MSESERGTPMQQVFKCHQLCKQDSPLGSYLDLYAAEMRKDGYPRHTPAPE